MINFIQNFRADEDGAVTVDWVVLTAAVVGLGIAAVAAVRGSVDTLSTNIAAGVSSVEVQGAAGGDADPVDPPVTD